MKETVITLAVREGGKYRTVKELWADTASTKRRVELAVEEAYEAIEENPELVCYATGLDEGWIEWETDIGGQDILEDWEGWGVDR